MRRAISISLILIITVFVTTNGSSQEIIQKQTTEKPENFKLLELTDKVVHNGTEYQYSKEFDKVTKTEATKTGEKSPVLGALMSAVLPGAGEFYAQSYIKSAIFLALEIGLWTMYGINQSNGNSTTEEYQNIANQNWDIYKYAAWLKNQNFQGAQGIDLNVDKETLRRQVNVVEQQNFSHSLPEFGAQQYYEVIGKYQSFIAGWSYSDTNVVNSSNYLTYRPSQVDDYMGIRQDANDYYDMASLSTNLVIVNHILSAADAAWSVTMFNKDLKVHTSLEMRSLYSTKEGRRINVPFAKFTIDF